MKTLLNYTKKYGKIYLIKQKAGGITSMEYFWWTDNAFVKNKMPKNFGFTHFDATHIFWLVLLVLTLVICSYFYRKCGEVGRKRFRFTVAGLIFADEIAKWIMLFATGQWSVNYFPLHLCTINIFIIAMIMKATFHMLHVTKSMNI